mgnify:FL=1
MSKWIERVFSGSESGHAVFQCFYEQDTADKGDLLCIESVSAERRDKILKLGIHHCSNIFWSLTIYSDEHIWNILEYLDIETYLIALESMYMFSPNNKGLTAMYVYRTVSFVRTKHRIYLLYIAALSFNVKKQLPSLKQDTPYPGLLDS